MTDPNGPSVPDPSNDPTTPIPPAASPPPPQQLPFAPPLGQNANSGYPNGAQPGGYGAQPGAYAAQAPAKPGQTLGIVGLILAFFVSPAGIVVSAIGLSQSKKGGRKNGIALAGLIVSIAFTVIGIITAIIITIGLVLFAQQCSTGHVSSDGSTFDCSVGTGY